MPLVEVVGARLLIPLHPVEERIEDINDGLTRARALFFRLLHQCMVLPKGFFAVGVESDLLGAELDEPALPSLTPEGLRVAGGHGKAPELCRESLPQGTQEHSSVDVSRFKA